MGDDLEARLRTHAAATAWNPFGELCAEAADEVVRLRAERDALRRTVEGYNGLGHWRCRQAVELHCPDCLSPAPHHSSGCRILAALATSSPSASGPS
jgi:hypothetical protein